MAFSKRSWFPTEFITTVTLKTDQDDSTSSSKFHRSFCTIKTLPFFSSSLGVCVFRFAHIFLCDAVGFTYRRSKSRKNSFSSLFLLYPLSLLAVGPVLPWLSFFLFSKLLSNVYSDQYYYRRAQITLLFSCPWFFAWLWKTCLTASATRSLFKRLKQSLFFQQT